MAFVEKKSKRQKYKLNGVKTYDDILIGWTQCCYLVPRKNKLCNIARVANSLYCGNHIQSPATAPSLDKTIGDSIQPEKFIKERIPCPIDPSHTIYKQKLESHILICNAQKYENNLVFVSK